MKAVLILCLLLLTSPAKGMEVAKTVQSTKPDNLPYASLGGGCFWCLESEFRKIEGVVFTRSGYEGGTMDNPTYPDVATGGTGHAEMVEIYYDPKTISYRELLDYFLRKGHDPTQIDRQGVDVGPQYRSVIFYHDEEQKKEAQAAIDAAQKDQVWKDPIVTSLEPHTTFWPAEEEHQQYYEKFEKMTGSKHIRILMKETERQALQ